MKAALWKGEFSPERSSLPQCCPPCPVAPKPHCKGTHPDNKLAALKGLEKLQLELDDTMKRLKREQTLVFRKTTKDSFKHGIQQGIGELADAALPFYADLKPEGIDKLATKVFTIVDTNALDFMAQYNLTLAAGTTRRLPRASRSGSTVPATGCCSGPLTRLSASSARAVTHPRSSSAGYSATP